MSISRNEPVTDEDCEQELVRHEYGTIEHPGYVDLPPIANFSSETSVGREGQFCTMTRRFGLKLEPKGGETEQSPGAARARRPV
jgi:hypothetical protein